MEPLATVSPKLMIDDAWPEELTADDDSDGQLESTDAVGLSVLLPVFCLCLSLSAASRNRGPMACVARRVRVLEYYNIRVSE